MLDDLRRFSTGAFPEASRHAAWAEVLAKALVRCNGGAATDSGPPLEGRVSSRSSALDSVFIHLAASPQVLKPDGAGVHRCRHAVLLFALLEGRGELVEDADRRPLPAGTAVLLDAPGNWRSGAASGPC